MITTPYVMKKHTLLAALIGIVLPLLFPTVLFANQPTDLVRQFKNPPEEAKPWSFWYWMYGAVSRSGITADLEAMQQSGLGGTYLMPIKSPEQAPSIEFPNPVMQLTPEWYEMVSFAMEEADRLGLKLGMHICDGFALAGGPWIEPHESMQKVVWADTIIAGGAINSLPLPQPEAFEGYYKDIALFALPVEVTEEQTPIITSNHPEDPTPFTADKDAFRSKEPCYIQYEYARPFTLRNVEIVLAGNNYQAHRLRVMASDDGTTYRLVKQLKPARQGWQNTDKQSTHAVPPTTARFFRFYWDPAGSEPGSEDMDAAKWRPNLKIKQLILSGEPRIHQWEGKAGFVWRVSNATTEEELPDADCIRKEEIIHLTAAMHNNGLLTTTLPAGNWRILRMGHTATGHINATGGAGKGLECDKFDATAVRKQFDNWFGTMFRNTTPGVAQRVLKYMHIDSWECGSQNWSASFPAEFNRRRGYDLLPYLPLLAGIPIESSEKSEAVLRDVRNTIAELVVDVFYGVLAERAKAYDCQLSAECVAPTMVSDGLAHYRMVDRPMGEFWLQSPTHDKLNDMLDAISGAHIYGKKYVQAEGFTQVRGTWNEYPAMLKTLLDRNFALGINKMFYHVYALNPWTDRRPGMTLDGIGLFFQRDQTWWKPGKAFVDYTARCQALLQYGVPVTDIAVFTGEEIPRRAILPDRLVPSLPGLFGDEKVKSEQVRLANEGQPIREMPVGVYHSANMADPDKWVNPLRGYAYDSFNKDALLHLAKAEDGCIKLPGGASYRVLVLPLPRPMNPDGLPLSAEVQAKIDEFRRAGVIIPELPYQAKDFTSNALERDVEVPSDIAWTHRRGAEADIYFIANQKEESVEFVASLRISGKQPELWNAVTGTICNAPQWRANGQRTEVSLQLAAGESVFIIFQSPTTASSGQKKETQPTQRQSLSANQWKIHFVETEKEIMRSSLIDWSKEEDPAIRYYSGTAVYTAEFEWKGSKQETTLLHLGEVCMIATVSINGVNCGTAWTAPWQVDISKALRRGKNRIEIEVVNTWANAIRGADAGIPPFAGIWTNAKYRMKSDELIPSGLLGPVEIVGYK